MNELELERVEAAIGAFDVGALSRAEPGQVVAITKAPSRAVVCLQPSHQGAETTVVILDAGRFCTGPFEAGSKPVLALAGLTWVKPTRFIGHEGWEAILRHLQELAIHFNSEFVKPASRTGPIGQPRIDQDV